MATVLVIGAYGLVGASLCPRLCAAGHVVVRQGRREGAELRLDLADGEAVATTMATLHPTTVVNLAAATNVDACEADPQAAFIANVRTVESLTAAIARVPDAPPHLIHVSSDQVYDGPGPHREDSARPCNVYALSKYAGELVAARFGATVLRTNLFGCSRAPDRSSLSDWVVASLRAGTPITVFDDVLFSAFHLNTLADVIALSAERRLFGIFNAGCCDGISKAGFALALAESLGLDRKLLTVGVSTNVALRARRPLDMRMNVSAFERAFGTHAPTIDSQIQLASQEYRNEYTRP
jgi:dTDP-4-dehydrorhamnose reductase